MSARVVWIHGFLLWASWGFAAQHSPAPRGAQPPASRTEAVELVRQGNESVGVKQFEQAKLLFNRAIQSDPKFPDGYENLALILLLEGNDTSAERTSVKLMAIAPANYNARLVAGVAAINRNEFSLGADYLSPLIGSGTDDPIVSAAYAIALERSVGKAAAARFSNKSSNIKVEASDALLAGQIFRQPRLKEIAQKWIEANVTSPATTTLDLLHMLATMYSEQGRTTEASALYGRILEASPSDVDALVELSELERKLGQQEKSASHLYAAKTIAATDVATLIHFSDVCMRRRMYVDARDALTKVVAREPSNRRAWYHLGLSQFRIGETSAAEEDFRSALALDANDPWSRVGLGAVLTSSSRHKEAMVEFKQVVQRDPRNAAAHFYLGQIYRGQGQAALAFRELRLAVKYAGNDARPWAALGQMQLQQRNLVSARTSLRKAIELDPAYATAHYQMAMLLKASGERTEAGKELELFNKFHDEDNKKGIVGLVSEGKWDYAGYLAPN